MFITATAPNPLVIDLIAQATNLEVNLTWGQWALGMFLPGIAAMLLMPLVLIFSLRQKLNPRLMLPLLLKIN
ncbi:TPA: anion permease [Campylobacter jejuni]|nr:anion permease [Campylobacter jejuni]HDZ4973668.1 anion permease [Campylobacter jejuni]